ncbi:MAG: DUF4405 domain-containing protein [Elusimicrobiota bacterium]
MRGGLRLNFVVDAAMFMLLTAIAGLGFLMEHVLIPGERRWRVYGRNVDLSWLGMDRHSWGDAHYGLSIVLLVLVALHVALHWGSITAMLRQTFARRASRAAFAVLFLIICAGASVFPFFIKPDVKEIGSGEGRQVQAHHH